MTAIAYTTPVATGSRLRLTTRGRRTLAAVAALPVVIALLVAIVGGGAALASGEPGALAASFSTVPVASGDSLWSIAESVAPHADPRDVIDAIVRLNALESVVLFEGQELAIPVQYAAGD